MSHAPSIALCASLAAFACLERAVFDLWRVLGSCGSPSIAACQPTGEGSGVFRSSNNNRRSILKSFKMRRLEAMWEESFSNL
jgi:hypothetical protein